MSSSRRRRCHSRDGERDTEESRSQGQASKHTTENDDRLRREHFLKPDSDQIDLNLLLDAVLDINDKLRTQEQNNSSGKSDGDFDSVCASTTSGNQKERELPHKRLNSTSQRERQNYSFRNDQVFDIDRENQRLLKEITRRRPHSASTSRDRKYRPVNEPFRLKTSSEVNRIRFQKRIEQENQVLLRRLEAVKPDRSLDREHMMKEQVRGRVRPSSASRPSSSRPCSSGRMSARTLSDCHLSTFDENASQRSFPANSRKSSAKKSFPKPSWEAGW